MNETALRTIGLTDSEIKVYRALLELKDATRGAIVSESGIAGSKVYDVLDRLQQKGLVSIYMLNSVKHFKAVSPKQILTYLEEKREDLDQVKVQVEKILPNLISLFEDGREEQEIELMSGLQGLNIIFKEQVDMLKPGETCYVIGGTKGSDEEDVLAFFEKVHLWREEKKIKTKMLFNVRQKGSTETHYPGEKFPNSETKYIKHTSPVAINIWADRTAILIFGKKTSAIYIKSQDVANSFMEYFDILWKTAQ
ncbi:MAG: helix-turn-helix domain-containing protein [Candidatus Woesearchaeota archaeon]